MKTAEMQKTLIGLEKQYWEAMKKKDGETAARLTDDTCLVVGPQGVMEIDQDSLKSMFDEAPYDLRDYRIDDKHAAFRSIGPDVAVLSYPVHEEMVADGKTSTLDAIDTSVWVNRGGHWMCAVHTETIAGEPQTR